MWTPLHLELDDPSPSTQHCYTYTMALPSETVSDFDIGSHAGTLDLTGNDWENQPNRSPSFDGQGPGGPSIRKNALSLLGWIALLTPFAIAVALSASSLQKSKQALELAKTNSLEIESSNEKMVAIENFSPPSSINAALSQPPAPNVVATPNPTPLPTTGKPTEPHPLNPQWFQTTHRYYQDIVDSYTGQNSNLLHSYRVARQICQQHQLVLCDYDAYCPNGQGEQPYGGGPPMVHNFDSLHVTQWAPYQHEDKILTSDPAFTNWVQIGTMEEDKGGQETNDYVRCWKYDDWTGGSGEDIEENWSDEHRMWMLCCEKSEEA